MSRCICRKILIGCMLKREQPDGSKFRLKPNVTLCKAKLNLILITILESNRNRSLEFIELLIIYLCDNCQWFTYESSV